jgi:hypothetical protein
MQQQIRAVCLKALLWINGPNLGSEGFWFTKPQRIESSGFYFEVWWIKILHMYQNHITQVIKSSWKFTNVNDGHLNSCNLPHAHRLPYGGFLCAYIGKLCCVISLTMHIRTHPEINELSPPSMLENPAISLLCQVKALSGWGALLKFAPTLHFLKWAGP